MEGAIEFETESGRAVLRRPDLVSLAYTRQDSGFEWLVIEIGMTRTAFRVSHDTANAVMDGITRAKPEQVRAC